MKINKKRSKTQKRIIVIINLIAVAVIISVACWFVFVKPNNEGSSTYTSTSKDSTPDKNKTEKDNSIKEKVTSSEQEKSNFINESIKKESSTPPQSPAQTLSLSLSASTEADSVLIRTVINNNSAGTCTLSASSNGATKTYTADILYQPQDSSCAGFTIPVSELGYGTWKIGLSVTSIGQTIEKEITHTVRQP